MHSHSHVPAATLPRLTLALDTVVITLWSRSFTGEYAEMNNRNYGNNQYFDVYSPVISTVYGQV